MLVCRNKREFGAWCQLEETSWWNECLVKDDAEYDEIKGEGKNINTFAFSQ